MTITKLTRTDLAPDLEAYQALFAQAELSHPAPSLSGDLQPRLFYGLEQLLYTPAVSSFMLVNRMKQTIRARRKRHFNAEHQHTRKKSIDLEFVVWQRLAGLAQRRGKTLSETIVQLIEDAEHKEKYASKMSSLKHDLQVLLGKE